jgi:YbgC/YbaW family acyl-CoA thioester hydrolase
MKRREFRHLERLRVRWAEVDLQKIVFNGHYLMYFDTAVAGYWRALALPYAQSMAALGGDLYVRKATLDYLGSARYDEQLEIGMRCVHIGNRSLRFSAAAFRGEHLLVHGELVYVFADVGTQQSRPLPGPLKTLLQAFETGEPVLDVHTGDWATLGADARHIRQSVFVEEQGIAPELVVDDADAAALHAVACNRLGAPVATGRLLQREPGLAQIGRMATLPTVRGARLGAAVLHALMDQARQRGDTAVMLQAQTSAVGFYERFGFEREGAIFEAAGVPHQTMRRPL